MNDHPRKHTGEEEGRSEEASSLPGEPLIGKAIPTLGEIGLSQFAPYLLNRITARWNVNLQDQLRTHDMTTTATMRALAVLSVKSGLTVNELSVLAVTEQSTMSRTLDGLEEQGLVRRQPHSEDARVRVVHITDKGRATFDRIWPMMYKDYLRMFEGIGEDEYRVFITTLHKVLRNTRKHDI
jgi:DNA-binding MarR family transcriptional regulator